MKRVTISAVSLVVFLSCAVAMAQVPGKTPAPGPEHKRLGLFVGKWVGTAEMKPSPWGPGGKMTSSETCEWFTGGFAVVCRGDSKGPMGDVKGLAVLSYQVEDKNYVYFGITSIGEVESSTGTVQGKMWNWTGEGKVQGKPIKVRMSLNEKSSDAYSFTFEMSQDAGKTWALVLEGESTRAK